MIDHCWQKLKTSNAVSQKNVSVKEKMSEDTQSHLNDKITNTVVINFLKNHQKPGLQQLAFELQNELIKKKAPIGINETVPKLVEICKPTVGSRNILVPFRKKVSKQILSQLIADKLNNKIANAVVLNFLKKHDKLGVRQLAIELQKELTKMNCPFEFVGEIPTLEEIYKYTVTLWGFWMLWR